MALGRKGLTSGEIKGLTVCVLLRRHAVQSVLCMALLCKNHTHILHTHTHT
ncbi:unnamed protein product [Staurois parvus]|uniref:Uncharacterized protein n=1 Tax=Staurois parvus TaxID=386267 RepID=A0ABN9CC19_9NEOB|nr:unnamed protein product [Staurois parvus]